MLGGVLCVAALCQELSCPDIEPSQRPVIEPSQRPTVCAPPQARDRQPGGRHRQGRHRVHRRAGRAGVPAHRRALRVRAQQRLPGQPAVRGSHALRLPHPGAQIPWWILGLQFCYKSPCAPGGDVLCMPSYLLFELVAPCHAPSLASSPDTSPCNVAMNVGLASLTRAHKYLASLTHAHKCYAQSMACHTADMPPAGSWPGATTRSSRTAPRRASVRPCRTPTAAWPMRTPATATMAAGGPLTGRCAAAVRRGLLAAVAAGLSESEFQPEQVGPNNTLFMPDVQGGCPTRQQRCWEFALSRPEALRLHPRGCSAFLLGWLSVVQKLAVWPSATTKVKCIASVAHAGCGL